MSERILVVDDEKEIAELITVYLQNEGFEVEQCNDGTSALSKINNPKAQYDLAILDIMLPDLDGLSLCKIIRSKYKYPVIMLTAKDDITDKIAGLTIGADDYITKPFQPIEMVARVKAQLRRYKKYDVTDGDDEITIRGLTINLKSRICLLNERELSLTNTEYLILETLAENAGEVVSSEDLQLIVSGSDYYTKNNNTISVHIRHIREKMGESFDNPGYIKTAWGKGYKIDEGIF